MEGLGVAVSKTGVVSVTGSLTWPNGNDAFLHIVDTNVPTCELKNEQ